MIDLKEGFVPRKRKIYLLFREECVFIQEKTRKKYIQPSKLPQTALVSFVEKKNGKKRMV